MDPKITLILRVVGFEGLPNMLNKKMHSFEIDGTSKCYKNANSPHKGTPKGQIKIGCLRQVTP